MKNKSEKLFEKRLNNVASISQDGMVAHYYLYSHNYMLIILFKYIWYQNSGTYFIPGFFYIKIEMIKLLICISFPII